MAKPARHPNPRGGRLPLIAIAAQSATPIYEQIYGSLRDQIVRGTLRAGTRLLATRPLAAELQVSRFTVVTALERLIAEGYLVTHRNSGTFVTEALPEHSMQPRRRASVSTETDAASPAPRLSFRGAALSAIVITGPRRENGPRPFHPRRPALDLFPARVWAKVVARHWRSTRPADLDYGDPAGSLLLRHAIAEHIGVSRAVRCDARQVIVTSGAQQAFDMLFRLLLDPGDDVWMEEPGYLDVRAALVGAGARLVPVPVDRQGIDVRAGVALAPRARLAVVSPSHQYPTGATLSAPRRAALIDWARRADAWIVEDDYDSYFRYRGRPIPALQRLDADTAGGQASRVIYVGTFSKTMFPSLRLGFCIVPDHLVDAATNARAVASRNAPGADQAALAAFILEGHYDRHLRRARLVYQERYEATRAAIARQLSGVLSVDAASAGTHVLGWFGDQGQPEARTPSRATRIAQAASSEDLVVFPLSRYCLRPPRKDALVLGYGGVTPRQIAIGAVRLARLIERTAP